MIIFGGFDTADLPSFLAAERELELLGIPSGRIGKADFLTRHLHAPWAGELPKIPLLNDFLQADLQHDRALRELLSFLSPRSEQLAAELLEQSPPNCLVLCPGHWESHALRAVAIDRKIPILWLSSPYFAWKTIQPFSFLEATNDVHITIGTDAAERLMRKGISGANIHILGTPLLDDFPAASEAEQGMMEKNLILYATQAIGEDIILFRHLLDILKDANTLKVRVRLHPATSNEQREELKACVPSDISQKITWSENTSLREDILRSQAVLSHSSSVLVLALLLQKNAFAWNPTLLPTELTAAERGFVTIIRSRAMLRDQLCQPTPFPNVGRNDTLVDITGPLGGAGKRIAQVIAQFSGVA